MSDKPWKPLTDRLVAAIRKPEDRKIGLEIERIGLWPNGDPFLYQDKPSRPGAESLLPELARREGWEISDNGEGRPMGLMGEFGNVSLEPGSQVELAARPCTDLLKLSRCIDEIESRMNSVGRDWGLQWICIGVNPLHMVEDIDLIPSDRYQIMTDYLSQKGQLGTSMMRLTSSVQINLDYTSEDEAIEMLRAALVLAPLSYALFANSPVANKKPTGWLSYRQEIWRDTDPDRVGWIPEAFAPDFGFDAYAKLAYHRPLMFAADDQSNFVAAHGNSLADIADGKLPGVSLNDANWRTGFQQLFFEARLKPGYVEVRSVDGQCPRDRYAATAWWTAVLYSPEARALALETWGNIGPAERETLFRDSAKEGLAAKFRDRPILDFAKDITEIARKFLVSRDQQEESLLEPVFEILVEEKNPAQRRMKGFYEHWDGSPEQLLVMAGRG